MSTVKEECKTPKSPLPLELQKPIDTFCIIAISGNPKAVEKEIRALSNVNSTTLDAKHAIAVKSRSLSRGLFIATLHWMNDPKNTDRAKIVFAIFTEFLKSFPIMSSVYYEESMNDAFCTSLSYPAGKEMGFMPLNSLLSSTFSTFNPWLKVDKKIYMNSVCLLIEKLAELGWGTTIELSKNYESWKKYVQENIPEAYESMEAIPKERLLPVLSVFSDAFNKGKASNIAYKSCMIGIRNELSLHLPAQNVPKTIRDTLTEHLPGSHTSEQTFPLVDIVCEYVGFFAPPKEEAPVSPPKSSSLFCPIL